MEESAGWAGIPMVFAIFCLFVIWYLNLCSCCWVSLIGGIAASMSSAELGVILIVPVMTRFALLSSFLIFFLSIV